MINDKPDTRRKLINFRKIIPGCLKLRNDNQKLLFSCSGTRYFVIVEKSIWRRVSTIAPGHLRKYFSLGIICFSNFTKLCSNQSTGRWWYVDISVWSNRGDGLRRRENLRAVFTFRVEWDMLEARQNFPKYCSQNHKPYLYSGKLWSTKKA